MILLNYTILISIFDGSNSNCCSLIFVSVIRMIHLDSKLHVIFIGGDYNAYVGGNVGFHSIEQVKLYRCNKSFIGCSGIDLISGIISTGISEDAGTRKAIMSISI